jgi:hypothetical protein
VHVEDIHHLLLRLTPPPDEPEDSSIGCVVQMPDGMEAEAPEFVWQPRGRMGLPEDRPPRDSPAHVRDRPAAGSPRAGRTRGQSRLLGSARCHGVKRWRREKPWR